MTFWVTFCPYDAVKALHKNQNRV